MSTVCIEFTAVGADSLEGKAESRLAASVSRPISQFVVVLFYVFLLYTADYIMYNMVTGVFSR